MLEKIELYRNIMVRQYKKGQINLNNKKYIETFCKLFFFWYVFFITTTISTAGRSIALGGVSLFVIYEMLKERKRIQLNALLVEKNYLIIYGLFFGSLILASFFSETKTATSNTLKFFYWTLPFWVVYFSSFFFSVHKLWSTAMMLSVLTIGAFAINQFITTSLGTRLSAPLLNANSLACLLELCLPFVALYMIRCWNKEYTCSKMELYMNAAALGISLFVLLFTQSRGGIAGTCIGFVVLVVVRLWLKYGRNKLCKKKILIVLAGLILICGVVFSGFVAFHRSYDSERLLMIESSYHMWEDHKAFGVGFDNWRNEYKNYISPLAKEPNARMPHNNIAFFFSTTGLVGGFGYCVYVLGTACFLIRKIKDNPTNIYCAAALWAFVAIVIHGMVDAGMTDRFSMQVLSSCFGVALCPDTTAER